MAFIVMDPDPVRRVEMALEDIRAGRMVLLVDDEDRENEGDLTMAAEAITPEAINFMATHGRGLICVTLTEDKVARLQLPMMASNNQSPFHTAFTVSIEAREGVTTGISAADRSHTIRTVVRPDCGPQDLVTPGHIFPLRARNGGVLVRSGQTEGSVDLARMAGLTPAGVICEVMNEDGSMARLPDLERFGAAHRIRIVTVADIIRWRLRHEVLVEAMVDGPIPLPNRPGFQGRVYRSVADGSLHLALWKGSLDAETPTLVRVQSRCPVGDVFAPVTCDCGAQLEGALRMIEERGQGVLLYMHMVGGSDRDELARKIRSHWGPGEEEVPTPAETQLRQLGTGAQILAELGLRRLELMTNNPRKIVGLEGYGLEITRRVPLVMPAAQDFLDARRQRLGHLITAPGAQEKP